MGLYVLGFKDIDKTKIMVVGGKGANLGELSRIEGIHVPDGFCVSTEAFKKIVGETPSIKELLNQLSLFKIEERDKISKLSAEIRRAIEGVVMPEEIVVEITCYLSNLGEKSAYAVRSSATAEDLPTASFAGQQDTYLNIIGKDSIIKYISKCWASLFTERAIIYRLQNGFEHDKVYLSVVVQKMIFTQASGILFTADPVTSNRKVTSIDASFGLGEALVSGLVNADNYKVNGRKIIHKRISTKKLAVYSLKDGGTFQQEILPDQQNNQALTDEQILHLEHIGRMIEEHFVCPQDIEWCLADDKFYVVQSRPITTLYPIPEPSTQEKHVYLSVGHQQMMTDPLKPLGMSLFCLTSFGPRYKAGGRLFVDVTQMLASPDSRNALLSSMGQHDPLMKDSLMNIIKQDYIKSLPDEKEPLPVNNNKPILPEVFNSQVDDPKIVQDLIKSSQSSIEELKQNIQNKSGVELIDFIMEDITEFKKILFDPKNSAVLKTALDALTWINEKMNDWLGEKNAADTLSQSVSINITAEMGLSILDVADVIRPYPEIIDYLKNINDDNFLENILKYDGGQEVRDAIYDFLSKYGMRCAGEIDITNTRWSEKPAILLPMILNNIKNFEPGESKRKFKQGLQEALKKEQELLVRLKQLPGGEQKAKETKRVIDILRNLTGYREYPKYGIVNRYLVYKQALMKEAGQLVNNGVINEKEDIYYLTLEELREVVSTKILDYEIIKRRKEEYKSYEKLTPPRVITSDGEIVAGEYKRENIPTDAIVGLSVSTGVIEGRARVVLNMEDANLEEGDILVTKFTDPSWTPLFVSVKGLVTEVGGLMTHGAVIAREYGLPAVVGVENATRLIKDGQRIRVNGTDGYIEIL
jgi:pyruvate,water dikinase